MKTTKTALGREVRRLLIERDMKMQKLALALGMGRATLYQLLDGFWISITGRSPIHEDCGSMRALRAWMKDGKTKKEKRT